MRGRRWSEEWWINVMQDVVLALLIVLTCVGVARFDFVMAAVSTALLLAGVSAIAYAHARRRCSLERDIRADIR